MLAIYFQKYLQGASALLLHLPRTPKPRSPSFRRVADPRKATRGGQTSPTLTPSRGPRARQVQHQRVCQPDRKQGMLGQVLVFRLCCLASADLVPTRLPSSFCLHPERLGTLPCHSRLTPRPKSVAEWWQYWGVLISWLTLSSASRQVSFALALYIPASRYVLRKPVAFSTKSQLPPLVLNRWLRLLVYPLALRLDWHCSGVACVTTSMGKETHRFWWSPRFAPGTCPFLLIPLQAR
jgi:hypothetical protein